MKELVSAGWATDTGYVFQEWVNDGVRLLRITNFLSSDIWPNGFDEYYEIGDLTLVDAYLKIVYLNPWMGGRV